MIFVTVGSTYFNELVQEVDRLAGAGVIQDHVLAQIGSGEYIPHHLEWVRYLDDLNPSYDQADLVICHGGVGTVFELLLLKKPFIAVANRALAGDHQTDLLRALEAKGWCTVCLNMSKLGELIKEPPTSRPYLGESGLSKHVWKSLTLSPADFRARRR